MYKTKKCNAFFKKGYCQYGDRCNFSHRTDCSQTALPFQHGYIDVRKSYEKRVSRVLQLIFEDEEKSDKSTESGETVQKKHNDSGLYEANSSYYNFEFDENESSEDIV